MSQQGLVERRGLDATEIHEIIQLAQLCNAYEGLDLKLNWNILRHRPSDQLSDFLYYADDRLVGFLPLFSFSSQEGEVSGMVHPAYRRRGIFSALFEAACQEARRRGLPSLLLIVEQASTAGQAFARHLSTTYDHSEYKMILEEPRLLTTTNDHLQFRPARPSDIQIFTRITAQAFNVPENEVDWYTEQSFTEPDRRYYVGEIDGVVVGKIDVSLSEEASLILGFAVSPEYQRRGYGRQILTHTVQEILKSGQQNIWLEVVTNNRQALSLYQSCGFKETGCYDYYRDLLS
ncbi:MAG TPA: GNAT family N-acetyltransferase [Ktedonobacteraceae bacterium]|nr:GNAT family N-acetyltransferase [Ktedonobacteraceae bacterium]